LETITIGEIVSKLDKLKEVDSKEFEESKDIWSSPERGECEICQNITNDQLHTIMKDTYYFCDKCGYNLVVFLQGHGFSSDTYYAYVDYLKEEFRNKLKGLEECFKKPIKGLFNAKTPNQN
jgi:uncharacterized protein (UPF0297 family)